MKGGTEGYLQDISQRVEEEKTGETARRNNNIELRNKSKKIQTKRNLKIFREAFVSKDADEKE